MDVAVNGVTLRAEVTGQGHRSQAVRAQTAGRLPRDLSPAR
ncbi:MAG TPA: hypothetical protein VNF47_20165 [Streptosporangiaceae bacterium]|nr:hypothetical protein [Streptosporangiaceae bacterium]